MTVVSRRLADFFNKVVVEIEIPFLMSSVDVPGRAATEASKLSGRREPGMLVED